MRGDPFGRVARAVARRPLPVLVAVGALALGGAGLALRLEPSAATDTLVNRSSRTFEDTERFKRDFGDEAVVVLVKGDLRRTVLTEDLGRLLRLEGCLSGNVPPDQLPRQLALNRRNPAAGLPPACERIAKLKPAKVVYGPGTFVNTAATQIGAELARRQGASERQARLAAASARRASAKRGDPPPEQRRLAGNARRAVQARFVQETLTLALRYGLTGIPRIDSPDFVSKLVFDTRVQRPKSKFAYLFPSENAALVQVRLRPDLSDTERERAVDLFEEATGSKAFAPRHGASYVVTGVPVVVQGLADAVQRSILVLLVAALLVMAATLALVFRSRLRLLPLALALAAAALTFGALSRAGRSGPTSASASRRWRPHGPAAPRSRRPDWPPRWASWSCCSRRCRWCAASASSWCSASGSRSPVRSRRASPRSYASAARSHAPPRSPCGRVSARRRGPSGSASPSAAGGRSTRRSPVRAGCWRWGSPWRWWAGRSTPRAGSSP